ncbi:hypothetical protein ACIBH1_43775 [Nonomuraea sp. NPDC050663]|uniref:hypothetical protein n=1 Tax=Nonomuraea sp. NPDC050663 TaxID=3364370 RepID=UPI003799A706
MAFAGFALFILINIATAVAVLASASSKTPVLIATILLALVALAGGLTLILLRRPWTKGLGMGLMIGWALVSIVSAGWCTGLNPGLYA